jgi:dihydropteridine reductase
MLSVCLRPAITAAHIASQFGGNSSLLVLTGSDAALHPTPGMLGYGIAKDATHFLVKSLALKEGEGSSTMGVVGVLPTTIDTPTNRCVCQ